MALKKHICNLSSKCNTMDKEVEVCDNCSTGKSSKVISIKNTNKEQPITMMTNDNLMETNIDRLSDDLKFASRIFINSFDT